MWIIKRQRSGGFLITKIHQLAGRIFTKILKEFEVEINPSQGRILFVLWQNDELSFKELAKKTALGKSTLTSMLDRLEKMGYVERIPSKIDRRMIIIKPTEKNKNLNEKYVQISHKMNGLYYKGFTDEEIDNFENYLSRIFDNLSNIK